jgi:hypothetical protein
LSADADEWRLTLIALDTEDGSLFEGIGSLAR